VLAYCLIVSLVADYWVICWERELFGNWHC
jgi:hypothetical protein